MSETKPTQMEAAALVLLDSPTAMKLAVTWPHVDEKHRTGKDAYQQWAAISGCEPWQAVKFGQPLRRCGVCRDDGTTDPMALRYVAQMMIKTMGKPKKA